MTADLYAAAAGLVERSAAAYVSGVPGDDAADDGFFGPASLTWRVSTDLASPVAGLRSLLMQALHPLAMAGVDQHSGWRQDPVGRLAATSAYLATITFGERAAAAQAAVRVRRIHAHVRGIDPVTGRPYAAGDTALLLWVHVAMVQSSLAAGWAFGTPLSAVDSDRYVAEMTVAAELAGVPRPLAPASVAELERHVAWVRPDLRCTPAARESMAYLLDPPGLDEEAAAFWQDVRDAAIAVLPEWARQMYGYGPPQPLTPGRRIEIRQSLGVLDAMFLRRARGSAAHYRADARRAVRMKRSRLLVTLITGGPALAVALLRRRPGRLRRDRGLAALRLFVRGGIRYARSAMRLFAAAGEQRQLLREDLALQTAEDVADTLGAMKGVLMKVGQMASYVDDGLSPAVRQTLARLQDSVPPMSPQLAAAVVTEELGAPPERAFARWDPHPIAAASIGQVHRAVTLDGRAVAVKVQYPGIAETVAADLRNVALLRRMLRITAPAQDVDALLTELRDRVLEELDYRREASNQRLLAAYYDGHPTIHVPGIMSELSTRRIVTSELSGGARFAELASWPQRERDLAAETIYRFVFRSLYEVRAFNGDPHPGNYLFQPGGRVTFLDFGLVKHFTRAELQPLLQMARNVCVEHDPEAFRRTLEDAGFLRPHAPLSTQAIVEHLAVFYDTIREPGPLTITSEYASSVVRRFFDMRSPVADYISLPQSYVILQRINLGLFAVLGELSATANWRAIAEEIWPFAQGPASTPMGEAEATWRARHQALAA